jgi:hypothetical protein
VKYIENGSKLIHLTLSGDLCDIIPNPPFRAGLDFKSSKFDQVEAEDWIKMRGLKI